jgi:hypothetical protein
MRFTDVLQRLMRLLSTLSYWHPPLAECDWLPSTVFPFLQLCGRDSLITFELCATVLCNWCSEWLHFVPNPPITALSHIDRLARSHGGSAPLDIAWPALRSFFGEIATTDAALTLLDSILCASPSFLEAAVAADALLRPPVIDPQNVGAILRTARRIYAGGGAAFAPLPVGHYPVLPIVQKSPMWRANELQRIRQEADDTRQQAEIRAEIASQTAKIDRQRRKWMEERAMLRIVEAEQIQEAQRVQRQAVKKAARAEEREIAARKAAMVARRTNERALIVEWREDGGRGREEMEKAVEGAKSTWGAWIGMREQAAECERVEIENEVAMIGERDRAREEIQEEHQKAIRESEDREKEAIDDALAANERIERDTRERRDALEKARASQRTRQT